MKCADHITNEEQLPYLDWHERAMSIDSGKQERCSECERWYFLWERSTKAKDPA